MTNMNFSHDIRRAFQDASGGGYHLVATWGPRRNNTAETIYDHLELIPPSKEGDPWTVLTLVKQDGIGTISINMAGRTGGYATLDDALDGFAGLADAQSDRLNEPAQFSTSADWGDTQAPAAPDNDDYDDYAPEDIDDDQDDYTPEGIDNIAQQHAEPWRTHPAVVHIVAAIGNRAQEEAALTHVQDEFHAGRLSGEDLLNTSNYIRMTNPDPDDRHRENYVAQRINWIVEEHTRPNEVDDFQRGLRRVIIAYPDLSIDEVQGNRGRRDLFPSKR